MGGPRLSLAERNDQLRELDGFFGRHGRLRVLKNSQQYWRAKEKIEFECLDCGSGSEGGWKMQIHNAIYGRGCPICTWTHEILSTFKARHSEFEIGLILSKKGSPDFASVRYLIGPKFKTVPEKYDWDLPKLTHSAMKVALSENRLPGAKKLRRFARLMEKFCAVSDAFHLAFPKGKISYFGMYKSNSTSPGPFYCIDTGPRHLRRPLIVESISAAGILKHCRQESRDLVLRKDIESDAEFHGATIIGYEHPDDRDFVIRYMSRTGFMGCDTRWRAAEKLWGQCGYRQGETLALVVISELFPTGDWLRNTRPSFMAKDNGFNLELDGYSPSLRLALEYQGGHHYGPRTSSASDIEYHQRVLEHDKLKREFCEKAGVRLIVLPHSDLNPQHFVLMIEKSLRAAGISPTQKKPDLTKITQRWNEICANPLASFQKLVQSQLGEHTLIYPEELSAVNKKTLIKYRCGNCGKENDTKAVGLTVGVPRRFCPECKGAEVGAKRRTETLNKWASQGLPRAFLDSLQPNVGDEHNGLYFTCGRKGRSHRTYVRDVEFAKRHMKGGVFKCPECVSEETGISLEHVSLLDSYRESLSEDVGSLGLQITDFLPYDENRELVAKIRCLHGHHFELNRSEVRLLLGNSCLQDKRIVISACPKCCYPDVDKSEFFLTRSTVFHRLYVLKDMYPKVMYLGGFDPTSRAVEYFSCGEKHKDGAPHSPIRTSFRNLQKLAKKNPSGHLCIACGFLAGQVIDGRKSQDDLISLMKVMRDELGKHRKLPINLSSPTVEFISTDGSASDSIHTTKTKLKFFCGVPNHKTITATKDYYFNRAASRGYGFCPECVKSAEMQKAPIPSLNYQAGHLRPCILRGSKNH